MSQITAEELTAKKCKPCEGGGLSENDFIMAAEVNQLPVDLKGR